MKRMCIKLALLSFVILVSNGFAQNDNTAVDLIWFNDPPDAIGTKWQINVTGATDLDNDGLGEFYVLGQAPEEDDTKATLFQIAASGLDNNFIITTHFSWQGLNSTQRSLGMGDIDADGQPELIAGVDVLGGVSSLFFFEWDPTTNSFPTTPTAEWDPPRRSGKLRYDISGPFVTNVDADANPELVIGTVEHLLIVERDGAIEDPAGFWAVEFTDSTTWERQFGLAIGDLDNDGMIEIIDGAAWGSCCDDPGPKPTDFNILETVGEDDYTTVVAIHDSLLPAAYGGANGGILIANLDQDANDEIYLADVDGNFWVITPEGDLDNSIDSTSFHLLGTFPSTSVAAVVRGNIDGDDFPDFYVAGGFSAQVYDVEYEGGDITSPFSYAFHTIFTDTNSTDAIAPARLALGNDLDGDDKDELIIVSFGNATTRATVYIIESQFVTSVTGPADGSIPESFSLDQNYPNPFNPGTTISYQLSKTGQVTLQIYDLLGKEVKTIVNKSQQAGSYVAKWDGTDHLGKRVGSGIYVYTLEFGDFKESKKMLLLK